MSRVTAIISALVICIIVCLSWAVNHYRDNAITYKEQRDNVKEKLNQATAIITDMQIRQRDVGFAPIFPDICYHLTHYKPAAADIPVASDNPAHYADAIRYNARTPLQGSLLPLTRLVWA